MVESTIGEYQASFNFGSLLQELPVVPLKSETWAFRKVEYEGIWDAFWEV